MIERSELVPVMIHHRDKNISHSVLIPQSRLATFERLSETYLPRFGH